MMRNTIIALFAAALVLATVPANAACNYSWCGQKTYRLTDKDGRKTGDIYDPGHGRRLQLRDNDRRIRGYIERDGTITSRNRQKVGRIKLD